MKRCVILAVVLCAAAPLFATGVPEAAGSNVIGISKIVAHPALDDIERGIMDELTELGYDDLEYDLQNANGEMTTAASIANKFKADRVRLAVGIATPTAQALVNAIDDIPVVYAAVTNPVEAGLVPSFDAGFENVTGSSDLTPIRAQFELIASLSEVDAVGHVYSSGEANAVIGAEMARDQAAAMGIEFVESTVTNSSEVRSATQAIVDRVDAIYVSTDNTVVSALSALTEIAFEAGVPVISADPTSAMDNPVVAALGFNYYKFGRATGRLIAEILDGADPAAIPTLFMTDPSDLDLVINREVADALDLDVPAEVLAKASTVLGE